ncbi:MAG: prolyl oligopeptidase family serine peptidase [Propionibacteriaceae bacterium]
MSQQTQDRPAFSSEPPAARPSPLPRTPTVLSFHGIEWDDPYEWVRRDPAALSSTLRQETRWAEAHLGPEARFARELVERSAAGLLSSELGFPQRQGDWWFVTTVADGARLPRIVRVPVTGHAELPTRAAVARDPDAEVLVDFEVELRGRPTTQVGSVQLSRCGRYIGWTEDPTGREQYALAVRDLTTGAVTRSGSTTLSAQFAFSACSRFAYTLALDPANRPSELWTQPTDPGGDPVRLLVEPDERYRLRLSRSSSDAFVFVTATSKTETKNYFLRATDPLGTPQLLTGMIPETVLMLGHLTLAGQDYFTVSASSPTRPNSELLLASVPSAGELSDRDTWRVLLPHAEDRQLSPALALESYLLVGTKEDARNALLVAPLAGVAPEHLGDSFVRVEPWPQADLHLSMAPEWGARSIVISRSSFVLPPAAYAIDLDLPEAPPRLLSPATADAGVPSKDGPYAEERIFAHSHDGVEVPITVVYRPGAQHPDSPALLMGYGAYEVSIEPRYNPMLFPLLDRGIVLAVAHVRGGGEKGQPWHDAGRRLRKLNSVYDFLACRDHLVREGWCGEGRVACQGGSAGGLLVGAALNLAPEKFAAAVLDVPFVDPLTTLLDASLPLTVSDRHEFGDPIADAETFRYLRGYSPYENIRATRYPPVLTFCADHDVRVSPAEALKWVTRLREVADGGPFPLISRDAGHLGSGQLQQNLYDNALRYAWVLGQLLGGEALEPI